MPPTAPESPRARIERLFFHIHNRAPTADELIELLDRTAYMALHPPPPYRVSAAFQPVEPPRAGTDWMTPAELADAHQAVQYARDHRVGSLREAVAWYAARPIARQATLADAIHEFIQRKRCEGARELTLRSYTAHLTRLERTFPGRDVAAITPTDFGGYFQQWPNATTRRSAWSSLACFYTWARTTGLVFDNPVRLAMGKPRIIPTPRHILTAPELRTLLRAAIPNQTLVYWVLACFGGLRTCEIVRLGRRPDPWHGINLTDLSIDLRERPVKNWPRLAPISPALAAWLHWAQARQLPVLPTGFPMRYRADRKVLIRRHGPSTLEPESRHRTAVAMKNLGRRTYISCRLALPGASFAAVANDVGNSEYLIRRHYYQKVTAAAAAEYFRITPDTL